MIIWALLLPVLSWAQTPKLDPNKNTVCSVSITSNLQVQAFKEHLIKHKEINKYQFVELTKLPGKDAEGDWFDRACNSGITCDVLFMTGHFASGFFGNNQNDPGVDSEKLRELSCTKKCENILRSPVEVFLFGCNTLAGKDNDGRSPEEYFQVLTSHGMASSDARSAVSMRYGMADTYKDQLSATFHGNKMLYGFSAPAPASVRSTPPFKEYLKKIGPYEKHFNREVEKHLKGLVNDVDKTFKETMKVSADQCRSMDSNDGKLKRLCELLYGNSSLESKMDMVLELLQEDIPSNLTLINMFFQKNKNEIGLTQSFQDLQKNEVIKSQLLNAARNTKDLDLSLESLKAASALKMISESDVSEVMSANIYEYLGQDDYKSEMINSACEMVPCDIKKLKDPKFFASDKIFSLPSSLRSLSPEVEDMLVKSKHKDATYHMLTVKQPGEAIKKAVEARIPAATSENDENFWGFNQFYKDNPLSQKAINYFISGLNQSVRSHDCKDRLKSAKLSEEDRAKIKSIIATVKNEHSRKNLEELLK